MENIRRNKKKKKGITLRSALFEDDLITEICLDQPQYSSLGSTWDTSEISVGELLCSGVHYEVNYMKKLHQFTAKHMSSAHQLTKDKQYITGTKLS